MIHLWLYGVLLLASFIMVLAWGRAALQLFDEERGHLLWCKAFLIAAALTSHAAGMIVATGYRGWDIMVNRLSFGGSEEYVQLFVLITLAASKVTFVWAGSIDERRHRVRWPWWAFCYVSIVWGLIVVLWGSHQP